MDVSAANEMVTIPPGRVTLSDRRTRHHWSVELSPYQLAPIPVTRARYAQVTDDPPSTAHGDQLPVEGVSWLDAVRFCNALSLREGLAPTYRLRADAEDVEWDASAEGYRLPTEAEWEHACRAGTTGARYGQLDEIAWYRGNSHERIHDVGGKRPNPWGLHDMLGNVWEWCWDVYDAEVYGSYRVLRGGGWFDEHWSCRASVRRRSHPTPADRRRGVPHRPFHRELKALVKQKRPRPEPINPPRPDPWPAGARRAASPGSAFR